MPRKVSVIDFIERPGSENFSPARRFGELIAKELENDPHFYFFSPDETTSNKLDAVFEVSARAWNLPTKKSDLPQSSSGRIVELLSENVLFSAMIGHILNGEPAVMASYEAFFAVITSQLIQQIKFIEQSNAVSWRPQYPAINLLSTSTCWRQDHNGFSHQSPILISTLLTLPSNHVNCFFPIDDVAADRIWNYMKNSKNVVNFTTFNKNPEPRFIDENHANYQIQNGASIFGFISDPNPDFIIVGVGDIPSAEAISAIKILKQDLPDIRLRFVNIAALSYGAIGTIDQKMPADIFTEYFTSDKPIVANFHGYPETLRQIFAHYTNPARCHVHGFIDHGSTTTPFEMLSLNRASRYDLAIDVVTQLGRSDLVEKYQKILAENHAIAIDSGLDMV